MKPIDYITRTRDYYRAQGFNSDYQWATHQEIPFSPLTKPLNQCVVTIVTTAVVEPEIPKTMRAAKSYSFADVPDSFVTDDVAWDKVTTHTRDRRSYFPLEDLIGQQDSGRIRKLAPRFHFVPTEYSQKNTREKDAPVILAACIKDEVDIAILVPL